MVNTPNNTRASASKNAGNFKNDPARAAEAGRKGGMSSRSRS